MLKIFAKSVFKKTLQNLICIQQKRHASSPAVTQMLQVQQMDVCADPPSRALVLGMYSDEDDRTDPGLFTPTAWRYNVTKTGGRLLEMMRMLNYMPGRGDVRYLIGPEEAKVPYYAIVAVVGLGKDCLGYNPYEVLDEHKEAIRRSVAQATHQLCLWNTDRIDIEPLGHAESAAEGAALGIWHYQELRETKKRIKVPTIDMYSTREDLCDIEGWKIGLHKASAQNLTRQLQETPSNLLTPTSFAKHVVEVVCKTGINVEVKVEGWAESQSMNSFLAVGRASCETPIFLELSYFGTKADERPIVLIGQGLTYDSGGLCLKQMGELVHMRGDMTGAAVVVAAMRAIAAMRLPVNIRGLIPLCENVLGCNAFKPGDVYKAANGKTIEVQGTDHEDMLVLADTLLYAQNFCPKFVLDIGTTSGGMRDILDEAASGVFTNSEILWQQIKHASMHTGDRVWRMPLWDYYSHLVTQAESSDVYNYGIGRGARPPKAAAFLRQFVPCGQWMHIDATGVMRTDGSHFEYLQPGMAGRPTRTVVEFIAQTLCKDAAPKATIQ